MPITHPAGAAQSRRRMMTRGRSRAPGVSLKRPAAAGFSLVELMVAMVIGLLGIIVMMQVFSVFEGQKRTTTGGDDAISSGSVSLYGLEQAIKQSGWGINSAQVMGCTASGLNAGATAIPLVPVTINSPLITGEDVNTDTLLIVSGNGNGTVEGDEVNSLTSPTSYNLHTPSAFLVGERVLAAPQTRTDPCALALTSIASVATPNVNVAAAAGFTVAAGDKLFNLGMAPTVRGYAVRATNLTTCEFTTTDCTAAANWISVATNVVSLRAQYGRDTNPAGMDGIVDAWDQTIADPAIPFSTTHNTVACGLARVSAVRIAIVARNSQPEKLRDDGSHITGVVPPSVVPVPVWAGSGTLDFVLPSPNTTWPTWQDFRYKVFQTVVPLRNITSMDALLIPAGRAPAC